jgi:hypothetical protein
MTKRKKVFITSLIVLLLIIAGGFYYLYFTGQLGTLADLATGPNEKIIKAKTAQQIYDDALAKEGLEVIDDKIVISEGKKRGILIDKIDLSEFKSVRRFLWDVNKPEGSEFHMIVKTSPDGQHWDDWTEVSENDWYYFKIDKSVKSIAYMAEFSREEIDYGANEETIEEADQALEIVQEEQEEVGQAVDLEVERDTSGQQVGDKIEKKLYAHLYVDGRDKGRYLGSLVDRGDGNHFRLALLTDEMAFVSQMTKNNNYENKLSEFLTSGKIKVHFVDESIKNEEAKIMGTAKLGVKPEGEFTAQSVETAFPTIGDYLSNIVDINGEFDKVFRPVQISLDEEGGKVIAGRFVRKGDLKIDRTKNHNKWEDITQTNTTRYSKKQSVIDLQQTTRMKIGDLKEDVEIVQDDSYARLEVNDQDKGYYIGSGVNISGQRSDHFFPIWISNNEAWVGAGEFEKGIFLIPCNDPGGDYSAIAAGILTLGGVFDDLDGLIDQGFDSYFNEGGTNNNEAPGDGSFEERQGEDGRSLEEEINEPDPFTYNYSSPKVASASSTIANVALHASDIISAGSALGLVQVAAKIFGTNILIDLGDDVLEWFFGGNHTYCSQMSPQQSSVAYNQINSTKILRGAEDDDFYGQPQRLAIYVTARVPEVVDEPDDGDETPPESTTLADSPELTQVGISAGYSIDEEPIQEEPERQVGSPSDIPGWWKGGLIKTGTDLIVLIVVSILVVIGLIYLVSLLKDREGLSEVKERKK